MRNRIGPCSAGNLAVPLLILGNRTKRKSVAETYLWNKLNLKGPQESGDWEHDLEFKDDAGWPHRSSECGVIPFESLVPSVPPKVARASRS